MMLRFLQGREGEREGMTSALLLLLLLLFVLPSLCCSPSSPHSPPHSFLDGWGCAQCLIRGMIPLSDFFLHMYWAQNYYLLGVA